jgi:mono/diheme cytochrome c family protein
VILDVVKMSDAELASIISDGKNKMPAYKGKLAGDRINGLVKYVRGLKWAARFSAGLKTALGQQTRKS